MENKGLEDVLAFEQHVEPFNCQTPSRGRINPACDAKPVPAIDKGDLGDVQLHSSIGAHKSLDHLAVRQTEKALTLPSASSSHLPLCILQ